MWRNGASVLTDISFHQPANVSVATAAHFGINVAVCVSFMCDTFHFFYHLQFPNKKVFKEEKGAVKKRKVITFAKCQMAARILGQH